MNFRQIYLIILINCINFTENIILTAEEEEYCKVFAPNGVFNGIKILKMAFFKKFSNIYINKLYLYKTGQNGGEWEVRLTNDRKHILFETIPKECCREHLNRFFI